MSIGDQRKILSEKYATTPNKDLAKLLGISVELVSKRARQIGLRKDQKYLSEVNRKCGLKSPIAKYWKCYGNK